MAAVELCKAGQLSQETLVNFTGELIGLREPQSGFWYMDQSKKDLFRGILHSAQPLIALCNAWEIISDKNSRKSIRITLKDCVDKYIQPIVTASPFHIMPYGCWFEPATHETYRRFRENILFRFFMPDNSSQKLNHGLNGHLMSWAHAMALMGRILDDQNLKALAWDQIYWAFGHNPAMACFITGAGYKNPMPHSRFLGPFPGGFMSGFIGDKDDLPVVDLEARAQWNTTEYWNTPLANCLMALAELMS
jgi:hypothetical protein